MNAIIILTLLDSLMIGLLVATIVYCVKLNTRVKVLQDSKEEFSKLIERFDLTTQRAQTSIEDLQNISKKVNEQLSGRLDKANFLADDLAFMIEKGSKLADKMEGRVIAKPSASSSQVESKLPTERRNSPSGPILESDRKRAALEAVMSKASAREEIDLPGAVKRRPGAASARLRSKAEQELYDALKSGNS